jgi:sortase A
MRRRLNLIHVKTQAAQHWACLRTMVLERSTAPFGRSPRRLSSAALLITGTVLLLFALCSYAWMSLEQNKLEAASVASVAAASGKPEQGAPSITLLSIPKIDLQAAVLEGTGRKSLLLAPGHLKKTAWPGETGNAVIAAHRDTFFRRLNELRNGDDIYVRRSGRRYHYTVASTAVVGPNETSVIRPSTDARLTLLTCWPPYYIGPAPKRLVVVATLRADAAQASNKSPSASQVR